MEPTPATSETSAINPLQGTDSRRAFSTGNTYPAVGAPRAMTYWTAQTSDGRFIFDRQEPKLCGIRATHSPSPWMGDYGHFDIFPAVGEIGALPCDRASPYSREDAVFRPHLCELSIDRYGSRVRLAATSRCAALEVQFPAGAEGAIVVQTGKADELTLGDIWVSNRADGCEMLGVSYSNHGGCPEGYGCYFVVRFDAAPTEYGVLTGHGVARGESNHRSPRAGAYARFSSARVRLRIGTSFIDHEQARRNLAQEVGDRDLDAVSREAEQQWAEWLGRVEAAGGSPGDRVCLATAMYRAGMFPMTGHELDDQLRPRHRSPYDGGLHSGVLYTNNGFWDTHRTLYPLLGLIDPAGYGEIVEGFLQAYRQAGWLPKWASPGYRDCMVGTHSDAVIAEAIARGIPGFDREEAFEAIQQNAACRSDSPERYGRLGLADYERLGFVPAEAAPYSVSRTLDFAYSDWCVARAAEALGRESAAERFYQRSQNYRQLWDPQTRFMRPKSRDGDWAPGWDEFAWGGAYIESGPWQHAFSVPHDPRGLASLLGGVDALIGRLDQMLATPPTYGTGSYETTIHEMTEMALATDQDGESFGQYAHSNQPVHGCLWLPAALGRPEWTSRQVERVLRGLYTPETLPGDEDNGEMSAWYILAAAGCFPLCSGSGQMVHAPVGVFERVAFAPEAQSRIRVDAESPARGPSKSGTKKGTLSELQNLT